MRHCCRRQPDRSPIELPIRVRARCVTRRVWFVNTLVGCTVSCGFCFPLCTRTAAARGSVVAANSGTAESNALPRPRTRSASRRVQPASQHIAVDVQSGPDDAPAVVPAPPTAKPFADMRVVFVDDEGPNRRLGVRLLTRAGVLASNIVVLTDGMCSAVALDSTPWSSYRGCLLVS